MNSSLLVPAFVGLAIAAVVGVFFGDSLFSGNTTIEDSRYVTREPLTDTAPEVAVKESVTVDDFSWDDESDTDVDSVSSIVRDPVNGVAATSYAVSKVDEAPGDLFGSPAGTESVTVEGNSTNSSFDVSSHETQAAADLGDFFNSANQNNQSDAPAHHRSPVRSEVKRDVASAGGETGVDLEDHTQSRNAQGEIAGVDGRDDLSTVQFGSEMDVTTNTDSVDFDLLDSSADSQAANLGNDVPPMTPRSAKTVLDDAPSLDLDNAASNRSTSGSSTKAEISGDFEPVDDGRNQEPEFVSAHTQTDSVKTLVRKFKITNPKETGLPVTMSVNGEHVTLKPDQSFVIQDELGEVSVMFSRGGSFGFKNQRLSTGHYRFSVSREAGWKLSN